MQCSAKLFSALEQFRSVLHAALQWRKIESEATILAMQYFCLMRRVSPGILDLFVLTRTP